MEPRDPIAERLARMAAAERSVPQQQGVSVARDPIAERLARMAETEPRQIPTGEAAPEPELFTELDLRPRMPVSARVGQAVASEGRRAYYSDRAMRRLDAGIGGAAEAASLRRSQEMPGFLRGAIVEDPPPPPPPSAPAGDGLLRLPVGTYVAAPDGTAQPYRTPVQVQQDIDRLDDVSSDLLRTSAEDQQRASAIPRAEDPGATRELFDAAIQSAPAMIRSTAAGVAGGLGGFVVGGPVGSTAGATALSAAQTAVEGRRETMRELLAEAGVDLARPETMQAILDDPAKLAEIQRRAANAGMAQGVAEGAMTAATLGLSRFVPGASTMTRKAMYGLGAYALDVLGEGAGEAVRMAASGQEVDPDALYQEMLLAGLIQGPITVAGGVASANRSSAKSTGAQPAQGEATQPPVETADVLSTSQPPETTAAAPAVQGSQVPDTETAPDVVPDRAGAGRQADRVADLPIRDPQEAEPLSDAERQQYVATQDFDGYTRAVAERSDDADEIAATYELAREQEAEAPPDAAIASALSGTRLLTSDFDAIMGSAAREGNSSTLRYLGSGQNAQGADAITEAVREQSGMKVTREQVADYVARQGQQQGPRLSEQLAERYRAVTGKSIKSTQQQAPPRQQQPMDDVPFRRAPQSDPQARGQKVARVQRAANATGLGGFVRVVESEADLPTQVQQRITEQQAQGQVRGVYFDGDGEVYVVASSLPADPAEAARTIFHETIGHRGLRATLGERVDGVLDAVHRSFERDAAYLDIVGTYKLDTTTEAGRREAAEEFVARMAEDERYHSEKLYQRVIRIIQKAYRRLAGGAEMSTADVHALIASAARSARRGERPTSRSGETRAFYAGSRAPGMAQAKAEARDVQARRGLAADQRAARPPFTSEDLAAESVIVRFSRSQAEQFDQRPAEVQAALAAVKEVREASGRLLAPNGEPTNLNELQWKLVRTPMFKAWFGDWQSDPANASKVVDENGEPMVVYHGTDADFDSFDLSLGGSLSENSAAEGAAFFATNPEVASGYADVSAQNRTYEVREAIEEAEYEFDQAESRRDRWDEDDEMWEMENQYVEDAREKLDELREQLAEMESESTPNLGAYFLNARDPVVHERYTGLRTNDVADYDADTQAKEIAAGRENGHDSFYAERIRDTADGADLVTDVWAIFDSHAVKSATGNTGAFGAKEFAPKQTILGPRPDDVRFQRAPGGDGQMGSPPDPREAILKAAINRYRQRKAAGTTPANRTPRPDLANPDTFERRRNPPSTSAAQPNPRIPVAPAQVDPNAPAVDTRGLTLSFQEGVSVPVQRMRQRAGVLGSYMPATRRTTIRREGDLDTTMHEVAHALDDRYGIAASWIGDESSPFDAELIPHFSAHGSGEGSAPTVRNRAEGVAEWVRAYTFNPDAARAAAPRFAAHYESVVPADVRAKVDAFGEGVRRFAGQSAEKQAAGNIEQSGRDQGRAREVFDALFGVDEVTGRGIWSGLQRAWTDRMSDVWKGVEYAKRVQGIEHLLSGDDPKKLVRIWSGVNGSIGQVLRTGLTNHEKSVRYLSEDGFKGILEPLAYEGQTPESFDADMTGLTAMMVNERIVEQYEQLQEAAAVVAFFPKREAALKSQIADAAQKSADVKAELDARRKRRADGFKMRRGEIGEAADAYRASRASEKDLKSQLAEARAEERAARRRLTSDQQGYQGTPEDAPAFATRRASTMAGTGAGIYSDVDVAERHIAELLSGDPERVARLQEAAARYREWADGLLRYARDLGRITPETYQAIRDSADYYVAMNRLVNLDTRTLEPMDGYVPGSGGGITSAKDVTKRFKGSTRRIENPLESLIRQTEVTIKEARRNEALRAFRDLLVSDRRMYDSAPDAGVQVALARVGRIASPRDERAIKVFVDGKEERWQFHEDIHKALTGLGDEPGGGLIMDFLTAPARLLRAGVTLSPGFMLRNPVRDALSRAVVSNSGSGAAPKRLASAALDYMQHGDAKEYRQLWEDFYSNGGSAFGWYRGGTRENYDRELQRVIGELRGDGRTVLSTFKQIGGAWEAIGEKGETASRVEEYAAALSKARAAGMSERDAHIEAAYQARSITDYAVAGEWARQINRVVPFTNAAIQGTLAGVRSARKNPAGFAARWLTYVASLEIANYAWNAMSGDDEELAQQPAYLRDMFWNYKIGPDRWLRIPKPWELGVLASGISRSADYIRGDENAFEGWLGSFGSALTPFDETVLLGSFRPYVEAFIAEKDFFRDRDIIGSWEKGLRVEYRDGTERASRAGQLIQDVTGVDARKWDHFIRAQLGSSGSLALSISDAGREDRQRRTILEEASGYFANSPAWGARDVRHVLDWAEEESEATRGRPKALRRKLVRYSKAKSREERDRLAAEVREYAAKLRADIDAGRYTSRNQRRAAGGSP